MKNLESNAVVDGPVEVLGYTLGGDSVDPKGNRCFAKRSYDPATKRARYWVRYHTAGAEAGRMLCFHTPTSPTSSGGTVAHLGKNATEFRPVQEEAFDLYFRYLQTSNPAHVRRAERL